MAKQSKMTIEMLEARQLLSSVSIYPGRLIHMDEYFRRHPGYDQHLHFIQSKEPPPAEVKIVKGQLTLVSSNDTTRTYRRTDTITETIHFTSKTGNPENEEVIKQAIDLLAKHPIGATTKEIGEAILNCISLSSVTYHSKIENTVIRTFTITQARQTDGSWKTQSETFSDSKSEPVASEDTDSTGSVAVLPSVQEQKEKMADALKAIADKLKDAYKGE